VHAARCWKRLEEAGIIERWGVVQGVIFADGDAVNLKVEG
jgi:hypothetical protein